MLTRLTANSLAGILSLQPLSKVQAHVEHYDYISFRPWCLRAVFMIIVFQAKPIGITYFKDYPYM